MNFKKVLAGVLAAASVLSVAGCSNGSTSSGSGSTSGTSSSSGTASGTSSAAGTGDATGEAASGTGDSATTGGPLEAGIQFDASQIKDGMTLKVLTNRTDRDTDGYLANMVKPFEERYNCTITFLSFKDYDGDVKTMMTGDDYGDVLNIPTGLRVSDLEKYFEPLGSVKELGEVYNWTNNKCIDDTCYGLSTGGSASGICYNKKVWEEAGITELPKTEEDFMADLRKIKENTSAIPAMLCYTDAASWILKEYTQYAPTLSGDPDYKLHCLVNKVDIFGSKDNQTEYYQVLKWMYDMYKDPDVHETDVTSSKWEASKSMLAEGKIGTFIVASWGFAQFKQEGEKNGFDSSNVAFMPLPFNKDGVQYAESGAMGGMAVSKNSKNKELAKAFIKWWIEESPWCKDEGEIPTLKGSPMPDSLAGFNNVTFFSQNTLPKEISKCWDNIDKYSGVGIDKGNADNYKIKIAESALRGEDESVFESILADCNKAWAEARDADEDLKAYMAAQ